MSGTEPMIWLTRPQTDSERMARALEQRGIASMVAPVMEIRPLPVQIPSGRAPSALLITSRHAAIALAMLPANWRELPIYCVGKSTALAANKLGFHHQIIGKGNALSLVPRIMAGQKSGDLVLHLSGEEVRMPFAPVLAPYGIEVKRSIVYSAVSAPALSVGLLEALEQQRIRGVVFYSPRSVTLTQQLLQQQDALASLRHVDAFCLSVAIAGEAAKLNCRHLHACHLPTHQAMMELLSNSAIGTP